MLLVAAAFFVPAYKMRAEPVPLTQHGIEMARLDSLNSTAIARDSVPTP